MRGDDEAVALVVSLHRLVRGLRRASSAGLQPTQLIVLAQLAESGPLRIGELAERVPCSQPTATTVVAGLETGGLLSREPDPDDGRAVRVGLTPAGEREILSTARSEAEVLTERLTELRPEQREQVLAVGPLLRRLGEREPGGESSGGSGGGSGGA